MRFFRHNPLPELLRKKAGITDDRHLAIVTALIVEHGLDALLGSFLPGYDSLAEKTEFTFSTKIGLVQAFAFIPPRILTAANMIRKIRNEFAHDLDMDSFSKLTPSLINGLKNLRIDIYKRFGEEERKPKASLGDEYNAVAFFCIVGLDAYREDFAYLRLRIQKAEFIAALFEESMVENKSQLQAVMAESQSVLKLGTAIVSKYTLPA